MPPQSENKAKAGAIAREALEDGPSAQQSIRVQAFGRPAGLGLASQLRLAAGACGLQVGLAGRGEHSASSSAAVGFLTALPVEAAAAGADTADLLRRLGMQSSLRHASDAVLATAQITTASNQETAGAAAEAPPAPPAPPPPGFQAVSARLERSDRGASKGWVVITLTRTTFITKPRGQRYAIVLNPLPPWLSRTSAGDIVTTLQPGEPGEVRVPVTIHEERLTKGAAKRTASLKLPYDAALGVLLYRARNAKCTADGSRVGEFVGGVELPLLWWAPLLREAPSSMARPRPPQDLPPSLLRSMHPLLGPGGAALTLTDAAKAAGLPQRQSLAYVAFAQGLLLPGPAGPARPTVPPCAPAAEAGKGVKGQVKGRNTSEGGGGGGEVEGEGEVKGEGKGEVKGEGKSKGPLQTVLGPGTPQPKGSRPVAPDPKPPAPPEGCESPVKGVAGSRSSPAEPLAPATPPPPKPPLVPASPNDKAAEAARPNTAPLKEGHSKEGHSKVGYSNEGHSKVGHSKEGHSKEEHSRAPPKDQLGPPSPALPLQQLPPTLRLVTFNVQKATGPEDIVAAVFGFGGGLGPLPDVVCLQEAPSATAATKATRDHHQQLTELMGKREYDCVHAGEQMILWNTRTMARVAKPKPCCAAEALPDGAGDECKGGRGGRGGKGGKGGKAAQPDPAALPDIVWSLEGGDGVLQAAWAGRTDLGLGAELADIKQAVDDAAKASKQKRLRKAAKKGKELELGDIGPSKPRTHPDLTFFCYPPVTVVLRHTPTGTAYVITTVHTPGSRDHIRRAQLEREVRWLMEPRRYQAVIGQLTMRSSRCFSAELRALADGRGPPEAPSLMPRGELPEGATPVVHIVAGDFNVHLFPEPAAAGPVPAAADAPANNTREQTTARNVAALLKDGDAVGAAAAAFPCLATWTGYRGGEGFEPTTASNHADIVYVLKANIHDGGGSHDARVRACGQEVHPSRLVEGSTKHECGSDHKPMAVVLHDVAAAPVEAVDKRAALEQAHRLMGCILAAGGGAVNVGVLTWQVGWCHSIMGKILGQG